MLLLAILATPLLVWWQWYRAYDWWRLHNYTPPVSIVSLASVDTMTPKAKHYFYINLPQQVVNVSAFHSSCPDSEKSIVLGCYHSGERGIYIYNVKDERLTGVEQVTAAHEMLHGAYERLTSNDRKYIDGLTNNFYNTSVHDQRVIDEINLYRKTEPNSVSDEMHSVFGTEIANLPAPLETYYKKYFVNRNAVVNFAAGYQAEFTSRTNQINADDKQLATYKQNIDREESSLNNLLGQLKADRARLDNLRNSDQIFAYNSAVAGFNAEVDAYNIKLNNLQQDIIAYNQLVADRNAVAGELRSLDGAIDTRLTSQPAK